MKSQLCSLILIGLLGFPTAFAKPVKTVVHRHEPTVPFSFLPPSQPSPTIARIKAEWEARATQAMIQSEIKETIINVPPVSPISFTPSLSDLQIVPPILELKPIITTVRTILPRSWVGAMNARQASVLASELTLFLTTQLPQSTHIILAEPKHRNALTPVFIISLKQAGFQMEDFLTPDTHTLRYVITPGKSGIWVQLELDQQLISRMYAIDSVQGVVATSPFSIRVKP